MSDLMVDHNGKLALQGESYNDSQEPRRVTARWVSNLPARDYADLIGHRFVTGRYIQVDTSGWTYDPQYTPVTRPRDGKEYTWGWSDSRGGEWRRVYFRRCLVCDQYHDPNFAHCACCEKPLRAGKACVAATCIAWLATN